MEEVETPNTTTIQALADFLEIPLAKTAKAVFYKGDSGRFVFAVIRGDLDVNETKLRKAAGEGGLTPATVEEIRAIGAEPGYGSPVGVRDALIVIDESVRDTPNLVAGANRVGWHLLNTNPGRDYQPDVVADIAAAEAGFPCPRAALPMIAERAIEVGNIFKLGTRYSKALGAEYLDEEGHQPPDPHGIVWDRLRARLRDRRRTASRRARDRLAGDGRAVPSVAALDRRRRRHRDRRTPPTGSTTS